MNSCFRSRDEARQQAPAQAPELVVGAVMQPRRSTIRKDDKLAKEAEMMEEDEEFKLDTASLPPRNSVIAGDAPPSYSEIDHLHKQPLHTDGVIVDIRQLPFGLENPAGEFDEESIDKFHFKG